MPPELYGKCRELGYCDCKGFFGCSDPDGPLDRPEDGGTSRIDQKVAQADHAETTSLPEMQAHCGYCNRKGSACARHGGKPSNSYKGTLTELPSAKPVSFDERKVVDYSPEAVERRSESQQARREREKSVFTEMEEKVAEELPTKHFVTPPPAGTEIEIAIGSVTIVIRGVQ